MLLRFERDQALLDEHIMNIVIQCEGDAGCVNNGGGLLFEATKISDTDLVISLLHPGLVVADITVFTDGAVVRLPRTPPRRRVLPVRAVRPLL